MSKGELRCFVLGELSDIILHKTSPSTVLVTEMMSTDHLTLVRVRITLTGFGLVMLTLTGLVRPTLTGLVSCVS